MCGLIRFPQKADRPRRTHPTKSDPIRNIAFSCWPPTLSGGYNLAPL
jgi:hypothetical protein